VGQALRSIGLFTVVTMTAGWVAVQDFTSNAPPAAEAFRIWGGLIGMVGVAIGAMGLVFYAWAIARTKALAGSEKTVEIYKEQLVAADRREDDHRKEYTRLVDLVNAKDAELAMLRGRTDLTEVMGQLHRIVAMKEDQNAWLISSQKEQHGMLSGLCRDAEKVGVKLGSVERRVENIRKIVDAVLEQTGTQLDREGLGDDERRSGPR
jgi:hypothetical protein